MRLDDSVNLEVSRLAAARLVFETVQVDESEDLNCVRHHSCDLAINGVFQSLACFESWHFGCFDLNGFTSLRITSLTCCTLFGCKGAKADQHYRIAFLQ